MPDLSDEQADFLRRYIEDGFGVGDDSEGLAALLLESAFGNRLCGKLGVQPEDGEETDWWPGTGLHWDDGATGRMLVLRAAENRHMWDGLRARLQEQLETGEDPPKWLLTWAAEAFTGIRQPPSGPGSGRGRAAPGRAATERAAEVVETLRLVMGFSAEAAQIWIVENLPERWKDRDALAKALQRAYGGCRGRKKGVFCP